MPTETLAYGTIAPDADRLVIKAPPSELQSAFPGFAKENGALSFSVTIVDDGLSGYFSLERGHTSLKGEEHSALASDRWLGPVELAEVELLVNEPTEDLAAAVAALLPNGRLVEELPPPAAAFGSIADVTPETVVEEPSDAKADVAGVGPPAAPALHIVERVGDVGDGIGVESLYPAGCNGTQWVVMDDYTTRDVIIAEGLLANHARLAGTIKNSTKTTTQSVWELAGGGVGVSGQISYSSSGDVAVPTAWYSHTNGTIQLRKTVRYSRLEWQGFTGAGFPCSTGLDRFIPKQWTGGLAVVKVNSPQTWQCKAPRYSQGYAGPLQIGRGRSYSRSAGLNASLLGVQLGVTQTYDSAFEWGIRYDRDTGSSSYNLCGYQNDAIYATSTAETTDVVAFSPQYLKTGQWVGSGATVAIQATGIAGIDGDASKVKAVEVHLTARGAANSGYATVFRCGLSPRPAVSSLNFHPGAVASAPTMVHLDTSGRFCIYSSVGATYDIAVSALAPMPESYAPITPQRAGDSWVNGGGYARIKVAGRFGIPVSADLVYVNVTAAGAASNGYLTAWSSTNCSGRPGTSILNYVAGQASANGMWIKPDSAGYICVYTSSYARLIVDVPGYIPAGSEVHGFNPVRFHDSRSGAGNLSPNVARPVTVANRNGVPFNPSTVFLTITSLNPTSAGSLRVYPCGQQLYSSKIIDLNAGRIQAATVAARVGNSGQVCVVSNVSTGLLVDVSGYSR